MNLSANAPKYSKDAPFEDPVIRCDACAELSQTETIRKFGMCTKCGNRRFRSVLIMNAEESRRVKDEWGVDPEWLALFHEVNE